MRNTPARLFGTDGVRGRAGIDLTEDVVRDVGAAFGAVLAERHQAAHVLLARDTRVSGPLLAAAVTEGLLGAGVRVTDCGVMTTPGLCLLTRHLGAAGGVVVSASHNPPDFNGIKLVGGDGEKLPDPLQERIEQLARDHALRADPATEGVLEQAAGDFDGWYLDTLLGHTQGGVGLDGLTVCVDCAHGAAYECGPEALRRAGAAVITINETPEGELINVGCGSLHPQRLAECVRAEEADLGVAFDGDADRAVFVDAAGHVCDGDHTKYLLAADLLDRGLLQPKVVIGTVMSNLGLERALRGIGVQLLRTPVGDRSVIAEMKRTGARVGGEQSGHIIFPDLGLGDGIYTALRVCEAVARTGKSLAELAAPVVKCPQLLFNIAVTNGYDWHSNHRLVQALAEWEERLGDTGRILIRPSGTEPLLRIMVEAQDADTARAAADALAALVP